MSDLAKQHARKRRMEERAERMHEMLTEVSKAQVVLQDGNKRDLIHSIRVLLWEIDPDS